MAARVSTSPAPVSARRRARKAAMAAAPSAIGVLPSRPVNDARERLAAAYPAFTISAAEVIAAASPANDTTSPVCDEREERDAIIAAASDPDDAPIAAATFTRLRTGAWGLRVAGAVNTGDIVRATRRDGRSSLETVGRVVWSDGNVTIAAMVGA